MKKMMALMPYLTCITRKMDRSAHQILTCQHVHNDNTNSGNKSDGESEADNNVIPPKAQAKQNSRNSHHNPNPHHLGYYSGAWYDVLVEAKNRYRLFNHTQIPFPDRNSNSLQDTHDCLLETIARYKEDGVQLDNSTVINYQYAIVTNNKIGVYNTHRSSMTSLVNTINDIRTTYLRFYRFSWAIKSKSP